MVAVLKKRGIIKEFPQEIIGLDRMGEGLTRERWQVCVFSDHALAVMDYSYGRIGFCRLPDQELARIRAYIKTYQVDELPDLERPIVDGTEYVYSHADRTGVRSVWMNNPPTGRISYAPSVSFGSDKPESKGIVIYGQLVNVIVNAFTPLDLKLSYGNDMEIIIPRESAYVRDVWKQGDDFRVLVGYREQARHWMKANPQSGELLGPADKPPPHPELSERRDPHEDLHLQHVDVFDDDAKIVYSAIEGDLVKTPLR